MPGTTVKRRESSFVDAEGVTIHYHVWPAPKPRAIVQLIHGLGEYATRYEPLAQDLAAAGYSVWAADLRGHGNTGLGQGGGDPSRLGKLGPGGIRATVAGIRKFTSIVRSENPGLPLVLIGHSLGSIFAQKLLDAHAEEYDLAVLSGTALRTLRHMSSGDLNRKHKHLGSTGAEWLSRDTAVSAAFASDPLTFPGTAAALFGVIDGTRLLGTPRKLARDLPLLIQIGSDDPLGGPRSVQLLADAYRRRGGLSDVTVEVYPGARHEVYNETNRGEVIADLVRWLNAHVSAVRS